MADQLLNRAASEPSPIAAVLVPVRALARILEVALRIGRVERQSNGACSHSPTVLTHLLQGLSDFCSRQEPGLHGDGRATVIVDLAFVEPFGEGGAFLEVDVWDELMPFGVPQVLANVPAEGVRQLQRGSFLLGCQSRQLRILLECLQVERVVIDVDRAVRALVDLHAPGMTRLDVSQSVVVAPHTKPCLLSKRYW